MNGGPAEASVRDLLEAATAIAREAGRLLAGWSLTREQIEYKGAIDLVTGADRAAEALVVDRLGALTPGASILAEEGSGTGGDPAVRWIVDPLDGTTNFAHGYPVFSVSIALERDGRIELGVVYDPTRDECFRAARGAGATLNGAPIHVTTEADLGRSLLASGFPYDTRESPRDNLAQFCAFAKRTQGLRRGGSAALDLCSVAAGRLDGYWEEKLSPWDVAAGALIVAEAGGRVTGYLGENASVWAGDYVASNGRIHESMLAVLRTVEETAGLPPLRPRYEPPV